MTKQGLDIRIGAKVSGTEVNGREVTVKYTQAGEDKEQTFDKLIVCVGKKLMRKVYWLKIQVLN